MKEFHNEAGKLAGSSAFSLCSVLRFVSFTFVRRFPFLPVHLTKLKLFDFKNYTEARVDLDGDVQCFFGKNGTGKTNLLDAIHYLSFTKSAFNPNDSLNVRHGQRQFFISGEFWKSKRAHEVNCSWQQGLKKIVTEDGQPYSKFSKHIGLYPVVMIAPNDVELIWNGGEFRRRFFDNLLAQIDPIYLENLILYTQCLKQRNGLIKSFFERGNIDHDLLEAYDVQLIPSGNYIHAQRKQLLAEFHPVFENHYNFLANVSSERVSIVYRSELETQDFGESLKKNLPKDILLQRTGTGIHRDDFAFLLGEGDLKRLGSQGQQKSFLVALKLTEFQIIARKKQMTPLLLLDDIFDKLDDDRIHKLMQLVANGTFGQLLITDARAERGKEILSRTGVKAALYEVKDNEIRAKD